MASPARIQQLVRRHAAHLFEIASRTRTDLYDRGALPIQQVDNCAVISIGNIAVGGRGKSPFAQYVARQYLSWGYSVALLLRGYKGAMEYSGGLVSEGNGPVVSPRAAGDEAFAAASCNPGLLVHVGKNRVTQVSAAANKGVNVIVLDDGFQHRKLARHADIVLISPEDIDPHAAFVPNGHLRENAQSLKRASLLAGYRGDWQGQRNGPKVLFELQPSILMTPSFQAVPLTALPQKIHLLAGVAHPDRFEQTASQLNTQVVSTSFFPDHHRFSGHDLRTTERTASANGATAILTTTKDLPRLKEAAMALPIFGLHVQLRITRGESQLHHILRAALQRVPSDLSR
ncbi:MAG: tetraacyldisaccharide 4'-kinase [Deltaproteobacteria bacterium]|nr:tetraacyldisaccharide 4'-kinase [Deltaproteobacteria bacterium]MBN2673489.1 tetraacyldisaccharide 4'-kinase [Deltaproteobacteria bacterium]